ncbi:host attachment family protein [Devosia sp.]|uniref:host attachment family protein n=1 Tax=Devosia sp. TaxID=1871048 RepID=UPI003A8CC9B8
MSVSIPDDTLVVIADGHGATLLRAKKAGDGLSLKEERQLTPKNLDDEGPSGSRPEEQTPRQTDEATFAKQLAELLYKMRHGGKYEHLVLAADPQTLGQVRATLHKTVEASIVLSIDKELMGQSVAELETTIHKAAA